MPVGPLRDLAPCAIDWSGSAITSVKEGAIFKTEFDFADIFEAEHGKCAVDAIYTGISMCTFEAPMTRLTYANLAKLIPGASNSGGESGNVKVWNKNVGTSLYTGAQELIVKRIVAGVADTVQQYWLHFPKAAMVPRFDIPYNLDEQAGFLVVFKCFPDATSKLLWHIGDIV